MRYTVYMNAKPFIILIVFMLVSTGVYMALSKNKSITTTDTNISTSTPTTTTPLQISEGPITESGVITCIPKLGTGPQTMECALGLKNTDGIFYGLKYLSDHDENFGFVSPDITVEISGTLISEEIFGPDGNKYDTVGTIEIETISEI